jgi:hypothetical protein
MIVNVTEPVLDYEGKPVKDGDKDLLWKEVIYQALNAILPNEQQTVEDKTQCYRLTTRCFQTDQPDFTLEERLFIIAKIQRIYSPLVAGKAQEFFDKQEPAPLST